MKIATVVSYKVFPAITGGEKGIFLFYKNLSKLSDIVCFTVEENLLIQQENFSVLPVLGNMKNKLRYINLLLFFKIKNACRKQQIHHIIIEHPYLGWLGILLQKFAGLKLIVHSHNIES
ncbi:MAG TPA: glycosyl transferase group 1, partial [Chitinophagales bacterium]